MGGEELDADLVFGRFVPFQKDICDEEGILLFRSRNLLS